jgi:hypothetical protein
MFKLKKKQFKEIKIFFKRLPKIIAEHTFLTSLVFFFIATILGGLVFYKYSILVEQRKSEFSENLLYFDEKSFEAVLKIWQDRQKNFEQADFNQYQDPFILE